jgi:GTP-binding protein EngB required for normal cell division
MKQTIQIQAAIASKILGLAIMVFINSCDTANNSAGVSGEAISRETVVLYGSPGTGKSALCNSIFQQAISASGVSLGEGFTKQEQVYTYEGRKYLDMPGISDIRARKQAAQEIEKELKQNNNYKIVFVVTFEAGRVRPYDLETINVVCGALGMPFEYGIIFNKVTEQMLNKFNQNREALVEPCLAELHKAPSSYVIVTKDRDMEDADNVYLPADSPSRIALLDFIAQLKANKISA